MSIVRMIGIGLVFGGASIAWMILGGITDARTGEQDRKLDERVGDLWGSEQTQLPPELVFRWTERRHERVTKTEGGRETQEKRLVEEERRERVGLDASDIAVSLASDLRRKGLLWYSLYGVQFRAKWQYRHASSKAGTLDVSFRFPDPAGVYDDFRFAVGGSDHTRRVSPQDGEVHASVPVGPDQTIAIEVQYESRGRDAWRYAPNAGVGALRNFHLALATDFAGIDFPPASMSPSARERAGGGWQLEWRFADVITGHSMGVLTPQRLQPGELAAKLAFSAPVSLLFFFVVLFVLGALRRLDIHPMNYLLLAGAFFAFHLLFAYSADWLPVEAAFALASAVSLALVVSYLRLVVSPRFAWREAGMAQLVYLVGFSLAHFWEGLTGLTVTVLAIVTLATVMQLTGRVRWSELLASRQPVGAR